MGFSRKVSSIPTLLLALPVLILFGSPRRLTTLAATIDVCSAEDETCKSPDAGTQVCEDEDEQCAGWAKIKECEKNPGYMHLRCRRSCILCPDQESTRAEIEEMRLVGGDFGVPQDISPFSEGDETRVIIAEARDYLATLTLDEGVIDLCRNGHELCSYWATLGECEANATYMKKNCAPACKSCEYLTIEGRCPIDPDAPSSWSPGDLDAMFVRLSKEPYLSQYETKILSSPETTGGPWVVTMENVVSQEEADHLIELGAIQGYNRSSDVGKLKADGTFDYHVNSGRTSTNAWCKAGCYENSTALAVVERLSQITGINETHSEYLQLLRYEEGQRYKVHHDYIPHLLRRQQGVRILTLYLYLNDIENGGGTNFDKLHITVMPRRGRALLWPSVLDSDPNVRDMRTTHQALPVGKDSLKYGANAWFHQRDFKTPYKTGCS